MKTEIALFDMPFSYSIKSKIQKLMDQEKVGEWDAIEMLIYQLIRTRAELGESNDHIENLSRELSAKSQVIQTLNAASLVDVPGPQELDIEVQGRDRQNGRSIRITGLNQISSINGVLNKFYD